MPVPTDVIEQRKEINANAGHRETLVFEIARKYFNFVSLALGGAGAAIGWTGVAGASQRGAIVSFLCASLFVTVFALVAPRG